jgi:chemotaxis protein methyltransferase CheR
MSTPTAMADTGNSLGDTDYTFLCQLVKQHSHINLGSDKRALVSARVAKRLRALKLDTYSDYCRWLRETNDEDELERLMDVMSTNHTHFFREPKHFEWLKNSLLPQFSKAGSGNSGPFRLWSAASSSGEEPFTLAIVLAEFFGLNSGWSIEATDISTRVLERAGQAVYDGDRVAPIPADLLHRYFQKGTGSWEGYYRVKNELRERVHYRHMNLFVPQYPFNHRFHVIFCRNVMIYFDQPTRETLVAKLAGQLEPGGHLVVGHSESLSGIRHELRQVQPTIYRKAD